MGSNCSGKFIRKAVLKVSAEILLAGKDHTRGNRKGKEGGVGPGKKKGWEYHKNTKGTKGGRGVARCGA